MFCRCAWELQALEAVKGQSETPKTSVVDPGWDVVMDKKNFKVWRRPIQGSHLFEYRGRFETVHVHNFHLKSLHSAFHDLYVLSV